MPGMDGLTALERIRGIKPALKIAIVTAGKTDEVQARAKELGVEDYIIKPFEVEALQDRVAKLLS
jgi:CheY-like chemotaxis protein